jgi:hypothetical protein
VLRRDSLRFRCSALVWVVALVLGSAGDAFAGRECPHHRSVAEHATPEPDHAEDVHASHGGHAADHNAPHEGAHSCLCVGTCHTGGALALPALEAGSVFPVIWSAAPRMVIPVGDELPGRPAHLLPYAHGPPVTA